MSLGIKAGCRSHVFHLILLVALLCASGVPAQEIPWQPFVIDHAGRTNSAADVSFLLDAPAGRDGFIRVKDGHLVKPDGQRFRIWGVNLTGWSKGSTMFLNPIFKDMRPFDRSRFN